MVQIRGDANAEVPAPLRGEVMGMADSERDKAFLQGRLLPKGWRLAGSTDASQAPFGRPHGIRLAQVASS